MALTPRRLAAVGIAVALLALIVCDLVLSGFRSWWDAHALSASIVSSLLVLGVTALIVDEVVARRERKDRANSVAVQVAIVYEQAQRTYSAMLASAGEEPDSEASDELRALASMLLTCSPSLFDDPQARLFLENVQRLTGVMFRASSSSLVGHPGKSSPEALSAAMDNLHTSATPLIQRLSPGYRAAIGDAAEG